MKMSRDADELLETIRGRRSIRRYRTEDVPNSVIESVLEAAVWAPSAHNRQPWRFAVIKRAEIKRALAVEMGQSLRKDLEKDGLSSDLIQRDTDRSYRRITRAPVVIIACMTIVEMDRYPDARRSDSEMTMAIQSTAMAGQNLLIRAHSLGLGSCWMCAPLFCPEVVVKTLNLSSDWIPQGLITLGYPAEEKYKERADLSSRIIYLDDKRLEIYTRSNL